MASESRQKRVGELVREEIARMIQRGLKDPRLGFVSVMEVRMSADLNYAKVYVSLYGSESEKKSSIVALQNSAGWIRRELGKRLRLRYTPEVRFFKDTSLDDVFKMEEVFKKIHEENREAAPDEQ